MNTKAKTFLNFDAKRVPSPCFVIDEVAIENNLKILAELEEASGAKILLALKAFSLFHLAPLISQYLSGVSASGAYEARLGKEEFNGEVHTFSPAFKEQDWPDVVAHSDHIIFNSLQQWQRFKPLIDEALQLRPALQFGLRINPQHSEAEWPIYDPCAKHSRLGITKNHFQQQSLEGISGLHFHSLCEQGFAALARTLDVIEESFSAILPSLQWLNIGGGHLITADDYDRNALIERIRELQDKYQLQVYLEPGEAIAINSGVLACEVLDIIDNDGATVIVDTSATCHMPDTLEMPYRAHIIHSTEKNGQAHNYRIGGLSCLAGDQMGDYSFAHPLTIGQRLLFDDMAHYTMVKTNTFNGVALPSIALWHSSTDQLKIIKTFSYDDFKQRLS